MQFMKLSRNFTLSSIKYPYSFCCDDSTEQCVNLFVTQRFVFTVTVTGKGVTMYNPLYDCCALHNLPLYHFISML